MYLIAAAHWGYTYAEETWLAPAASVGSLYYITVRDFHLWYCDIDGIGRVQKVRKADAASFKACPCNRCGQEVRCVQFAIGAGELRKMPGGNNMLCTSPLGAPHNLMVKNLKVIMQKLRTQSPPLGTLKLVKFDKSFHNINATGNLTSTDRDHIHTNDEQGLNVIYFCR